MNYKYFYKFRLKKGITLVELLVSLAIIALLISIILPSYRKARDSAKAVQNKNNQRQIVTSLNYFAGDHDDKYPDSVATLGSEKWHWSDPRTLVGQSLLSLRYHRSVSEYLKGYVENISIMYCPSTPRKPQYLEDVWESGDKWDSSQTPEKEDVFIGSYCFYWNYTGVVEKRTEPFKGPETLSGRAGRSKLIVSDYFGYGHWLYPKSYTSCERFKNSSAVAETAMFSSLWSSRLAGKDDDLDTFAVTLNAAFTDGHVESYKPSEAVIMKAGFDSQGSESYPEGIGPGDFYLPPNGMN